MVKAARRRPARRAARVELEERPLDLLSDVLGVLRLRGEVLCRSELSAPWGLGFEAGDAHFHLVERGSCLLERTSSSETLQLSAGDLVVLPHGHGHRLLHARGSKAVPIESLFESEAKRTVSLLRFGGGGVETDIVCGRFYFEAPLSASTLSGLPPVLHVPAVRGGPPEWLALTMRFLAAEARNVAPGRELSMSRLVDLLFIQTIRHWLAENGQLPVGWASALREPRIGAALTLIHRSPERAWDVEALASAAGMSRSSFAQRFVELVGESPRKYLARWRVQLAAQLLRTPGLTISQTAGRVGYASEAAFSRVFKRYMKLSPAQFRARVKKKQR
jgi:AraC-like DNA-binding protein